MAGHPHILVLEDCTDVGQLCQGLLPGCEVTHVTDGIRASRLMASRCFDLIVLDLQPGACWLNALQFARRTEHCGTPIIAISDDETLRDDAQAAGADFCVGKPVNVDCLFGILDHVLVL